MPRTRKVPSEIRVAVFLDYRRLGKVYPVAKKHGLARSTVDWILDEFRRDGFSDTRRLDLPGAVLARIQEEHIQQVLPSLQGLQPFQPDPPETVVPSVKTNGQPVTVQS